MKSAFEMMKEVQSYENKKIREKRQYHQDLLDARKGIVKMSLWEKYVSLPMFKRHLQAECNPHEYGGKYYVHAFLCGINARYWSEHWHNYGAYLLEQHGYINVQVIYDNVFKHTYIKAELPKTLAEQVLFGTRNGS